MLSFVGYDSMIVYLYKKIKNSKIHYTYKNSFKL